MKTSEPMADSRADSRVGLARLTPDQLWQVPTFLVGLTAFLAVAASTPIRQPTISHQFDTTVAALRQGLQKNQDPTSLLPLAQRALDEVHDYGDRAAEVQFLAGSVYSRLASANSAKLAQNYWARAIEHFETALQIGPDEADLPTVEYRLGWALYKQDRDVPRALELMTRTIDRGADQPLDGYRLLVQANLKLPTPDLAAALAASRKVIELTDDRDADALAAARLDHVGLLLRMDRRADAVRELERIGARASRPLRVKARLLAVSTCEHEQLWSKALAFWQDLLADAAEVPGGKGRVYYNIGACSMQLEAPDPARALSAWQEAVKEGGVEGQAAGLRLGVLRLTGPTPDPTQALQDWRQALATVQTAGDWHNSLVTLDEVRDHFNQALAQFQEAQDYEHMRSLGELYRKIGPAGYADEKIAQAAEALAKELAAKPAAPADEVRNCYSRAAEAYLASAHARPGKDGFDALWHGAQCFLKARNTDRAGKTLVELEAIDQADARLAEGWFRLAELHRTDNHRSDAHTAYYRSMQYATTSFAARARFQLAMEKAEHKEWDKAAEILLPNLELAGQDRAQHEKSSYQFAWLLLKKQDYARAAFHINRATQTYPNHPDAPLFRNELADCYCKLAEEAHQKELEETKTKRGPLTPGQEVELDNIVRNYRNTQRTQLGEALKVYQSLADDLRERARLRTLTPAEGIAARRALLGMASCCRDLGEPVEAVRRYKALIETHRGTIEGLIACVYIIQIKNRAVEFNMLGAEDRREVLAVASAVLAVALKDLETMTMDKNGPDFRGENVWTRERWQQWLTSEQQRASALPAGKGPGGL